MHPKVMSNAVAKPALAPISAGAPAAQDASIRDIFVEFLLIGATSFGGGVVAYLRSGLVLRPLDYVTKLVSGVLTCKLPLDGNPFAIHNAIPGPSLLAQASDVSDSAFA